MIAAMNKTLHQITALCASALPATSNAEVPEWVHLLPAKGGAIYTNDRRGPYHVTDAEALIAASLQSGERLPIDESHATDLAAPKGLPAPARGWITELQARSDGIWGRVEWTDEGRDLVASRSYRGLSPVISHPTKGSNQIISIQRASLVNTPNLLGLATLHQEETDMNFRETLAKLLGLDPEASEEDVHKAVTALKKGGDKETSLQSQLTEISTALGVAEGEDVVAAAKAAKTTPVGADSDIVTSLQSEVTTLATQNATLTTSLNAIQTERASEKAVAFIDGEMERGRVIPKSMRDHYVTRHQADPEAVEKEILALPSLGTSGLTVTPPPAKDGVISLNAEQQSAARLLGISPEEYTKTLQAEQDNEGIF